MTLTEDAGAGIVRMPTEPRLAGYTGHLAHLASLRADRSLLAALPSGRSLRDLDMLGVLAERPLSQARLGSLLEVNRTVMISVIDGLETAGLVCRERDSADRRRYALRLTADGVTALGRMRESARNADETLTAAMGPAGRGRLHELLRPIVADLVDALPEPIIGRTGFLLDRVSRRLRGRREQALRELGIEPRCVRMLAALDSAQPCTQERLAGAMGVTGPTIVHAIDDYHAAGLILRDRNPEDRREHVLRLTPEGEDYLTEALKTEDGVQRDLARLLGEPETIELNALLAALVSG
ncbi:MarR family winged helix-turn-helix transcriptional regulator [Streptosporangium sp. CA-135522]|uniref:MarR family winged helix-turn-helix transcriptional regulator n=1 Tax=Streptosporangium sp. CA-135522 TaxID=3240072 RepID=UPI003D8F6EB0